MHTQMSNRTSVFQNDEWPDNLSHNSDNVDDLQVDHDAISWMGVAAYAGVAAISGTYVILATRID